MKSRDLPEVVKATFGVESHLGVKLLTSARLLPKKHQPSWLISGATAAIDRAHPILRCASQNYYFKSQIPDPEPGLSGGLGQQ
jgi:hypothetical protein